MFPKAPKGPPHLACPLLSKQDFYCYLGLLKRKYASLRQSFFLFPVMDPIASLVIFVFIVKAAYEIFKDAMDKMVDHSCDEKTEEQLRACVLQNPDVARIDLLQTRIFGNKIYADIEIEVDGSMPLREAHKIAEVVHNSIEKTFPKVKHIMVHVNPEIDRK